MLWKLAARNLVRHRTRTLLAGLAFLGGAAIMELSFGLADGTYADMIGLATTAFSGQGQVHRAGYRDDPSLYSVIRAPERVRSSLLATPGVTGASTRLLAHALVSAGEHTAGAMAIGLDPRQEDAVTAFSAKLCAGRLFRPGPIREVLIGKGLAQVLHAKVGDRLVLVAQAADGSLANDLFTVTGLIQTGMEDLDRSLLFMDIEVARAFFVLPDAAHEITFRTVDPLRIDRIVERIRQRLGAAGKDLEVLSWKRVMPELYTSIELDRASGYVTLAIIALICALGVINTVLMSVLERTREFGVLRALGTRPGQIARLVMFETVLLAVAATALGMGAGAAAIWLMRDGVPLGARIEFGGVVLDSMRARFSARALGLTPLLMLGAGLLAGLPPAFRAARIVPVAALREE